LADAESAANATHNQLAGIFPGLSSAQLWNKLGLTVIAGRNDDGSVFSQSDASTLENFAAPRGVQELSFWEVDSYDKATGWAYSRIFNQITSNPVGNDFSISTNPTAGSVTVGGSTTATVNTAVTSGSAQTVTLSATGAPAGVTVSLNPGSVTAGGSSTLTMT